MAKIPVVTIDGPAGSGKGTIAQALARELGWHYLDSGAIYRVLAWMVLDTAVDPNDDGELQKLLGKFTMDCRLTAQGLDIYHNNHNITLTIRSEACGAMASKLSQKPFVRAALLQRQRDMQQAPGLLTDGRDMGTVVFPEADLKIYLNATLDVRANRRFSQLKQQGIDVSLREIRQQLAIRDERDENRAVAPLKPAADAIEIDTTDLSIEQVLNVVSRHLQKVMGALN